MGSLNIVLKLHGSVSRHALKMVIGLTTINALGFGFSPALAGQTISYDNSDSSAQLQKEQSILAGHVNLLFPSANSHPLASDNKVIVDFSGTTKPSPSMVFGGLAKDAVSQNNIVEIKNGTMNSAVFGGASYGNAPKATNNSIIINGGSNSTFTLGFSAGYIEQGKNNTAPSLVADNFVTMNDGTINNPIYGGLAFVEGVSIGAGDVTLSGNSVALNGGTVLAAKGAEADGNGAFIFNKNSVTLNGSAKVTGGITAASVSGYHNPASITATDNFIVVNSGSAQSASGASLNGGEGASITAKNNFVSVNGGEVGTITGVWARGSKDITLTSNSINVIDGTVTGNVTGGDGASNGSVNVSENSVKLNLSSQVDTVSGGIGSGKTDGIVNNNFVELNGSGSVRGIYGGEDHSGQTSTISGNSVVSNIKSAGVIIAGRYSSRDSKAEEAIVNISNNSVVVNGSNVGRVLGGESRGAHSVNISNNSVKLNNGDIYAAYGGYANTPMNGSANVSGNAVEISGKSTLAFIYGGFVSSTGSNDIHINDNIVTLIGDKITTVEYNEEDDSIKSYGSIWGGRATLSGNDITDFDKVIKGNTLNLVGYRGTVSGIYNFETYNWTLPSDVVNGDTLVTIADGGTPVNLTDSKHNIADMQASDNRLKTGDKVTFISKTSGEWVANSAYTIKQGQFIIYEASLAQQNNNSDKALVLTIGSSANTTPTEPSNPTQPTNPTEPTSPTNPTEPTNPNNPVTPPTAPTNPDTTTGSNTGGTPNTNGQSAARVNPQSKSYSEGRAAALGFVTQGNDLISTSINGIRAQAFAQNLEQSLVPFMIMNGSSQRYDTGSHVNIKGFNMALGLATGFDFNGGHKATLGAFFEYGHGTYDTYNSFANFASVYGDGDSNYKGGGLFGRIDFANSGLSHATNLGADQADGAYLEASLRAGRMRSKFDAGRNLSAFANSADAYRGSYDSSVTYYGGHVAGGYVFNFDDKQSLDAYGRYLWTHMNGDSVHIGYEKLRFDSSTSSRLQIGGRYAYAYNEQFKPYLGAAYEYEFDGDIAAKAYEYALEKPSLSGSSGLFEAGFNLKPLSTNKALSVDVNGQGYIGERQGGGGGVKLKYQF